MAIRLNCPACKAAVSAPAEVVGREVACPYCARRFRVLQDGRILSHAVMPASAEEYLAPIRFTFTCDRCSCVLEASSTQCGQTGRCPTCGAVFIVPGVDRRTGLAIGPAQVADDGQLPTPVHAYASSGDKAPMIKRLADDSLVIVCPRCQAQAPVEADLCTSCGVPFTIDGAGEVARGESHSSGVAVAALTIGILALPGFQLVFLGPIAVILGIIGWKRSGSAASGAKGRGYAAAGIGLGVISVGLNLFTHLR